MNLPEKYSNKHWESAYGLFEKLTNIPFAVVERESLVYPGLMIGTPVKIVRVDVPTASFRNSNLPYIKVLVELPNGETRNVSGEVLSPTEKSVFEKFRKLFTTVIFKQYPLIEKNVS